MDDTESDSGMVKYTDILDDDYVVDEEEDVKPYVIDNISTPIASHSISISPELDDSDDLKHGGRRHVIWSNAAVDKLLDLVEENYDKLTDRRIKKRFIWQNIAEEIADEVPSLTGEKCEQKWKNLTTHARLFRRGQSDVSNERRIIYQRVRRLQCMFIKLKKKRMIEEQATQSNFYGDENDPDFIPSGYPSKRQYKRHRVQREEIYDDSKSAKLEDNSKVLLLLNSLCKTLRECCEAQASFQETLGRHLQESLTAQKDFQEKMLGNFDRFLNIYGKQVLDKKEIVRKLLENENK